MKTQKYALRFKITLLGHSPRVWRRIEVPSTYSFWDLHVAIQDAMGWRDYHLHNFMFRVGTNRIDIGIPEMGTLRQPSYLGGRSIWLNAQTRKKWPYDLKAFDPTKVRFDNPRARFRKAFS